MPLSPRSYISVILCFMAFLNIYCGNYSPFRMLLRAKKINKKEKKKEKRLRLESNLAVSTRHVGTHYGDGDNILFKAFPVELPPVRPV